MDRSGEDVAERGPLEETAVECLEVEVWETNLLYGCRRWMYDWKICLNTVKGVVNGTCSGKEEEEIVFM